MMILKLERVKFLSMESISSPKDPPAPNPPNFVRTDWDDSRIPGYKIGDGNDQTKPCG